MILVTSIQTFVYFPYMPYGFVYPIDSSRLHLRIILFNVNQQHIHQLTWYWYGAYPWFLLGYLWPPYKRSNHKNSIEKLLIKFTDHFQSSDMYHIYENTVTETVSWLSCTYFSVIDRCSYVYLWLRSGETCLHLAAAGHHWEIIHYLTRYAGADINAKVTMTRGAY